MPLIIAPMRDGDGIIIEGVAGQTLEKYNLVHLVSGKWVKADRTVSPTYPNYGMILSDLPLNDKGRILLYGLVSNLEWNWVDGPIFASEIPGGLTQDPPEWSGWTQSIGSSHGPDYMLFAPMWLKSLAPSTRLMEIGQYTGDAGASQAIDGVGFQPKYVKIFTHDVGDADAWVFERLENMAPDKSVTHYAGYHLSRGNRIKSLDADGFTVADQANTEGKVYDYLAFG